MIRETHHTIVLDFAQMLERDGGLRANVRRADTPLKLIGIEGAELISARLKSTYIASDEEVLGACLILMAQRSVTPFKRMQKAIPNARFLLATRLGEKHSTNRLLSELRFQRLLRAADVQDQLTQMRRALALLKTEIDPLHVLEGFISLQSGGGRRAFARAYFNGPNAETSESQADESQVAA